MSMSFHPLLRVTSILLIVSGSPALAAADGVILDGDAGRVTALAFSPDGATLASAYSSGTIHLWDVEREAVSRTLEGHRRRVNELAFSPCGTQLASAGEDRTVRVWSVACGEPVQVLTDHTRKVFCVAFSADGSKLAAGGDDDTACIWKLTNGELISRVAPEKGAVLAVAFRPDDRFITGCRKKNAIVWKLPAKPVRVSRDDVELRRAFAFSADGSHLAVVNKDHHTDKLQAMKIMPTDRLNAATTEIEAPIFSMEFSPDARLLAVGTGSTFQVTVRSNFWASAAVVETQRDNCVRVWDIEERRVLQRFEGHRASILSLAFAPNGLTLASGSKDGDIRLWPVKPNDEPGQAELADRLP